MKKSTLNFFISLILGLCLGCLNSSQRYKLDEVYSTLIPADLRLTFNDYLRNDTLEIPRETHALKSGQLQFFKEQFMVLEIAAGHMGGWLITILIDRKDLKMWHLWIYQTDEKEYQIRGIEELALDKKEVEHFLSKRYLKYWL